MSLTRLAEESLQKYGEYVSLAYGKILRKEPRGQS
jgi:hypothetical protein